jgi:hypothetical protein
MKAIKIIALVTVLYAALLAAAFVADCCRLRRQAADQVAEVEEVVKNVEQRYLEKLAQLPDAERYRTAAAELSNENSLETRHRQFEKIVDTVSRDSLSKLPSTEPIWRGLIDELQGLLNRRRVALREEEKRQADYVRFTNSVCGRVAWWCQPR